MPTSGSLDKIGHMQINTDRGRSSQPRERLKGKKSAINFVADRDLDILWDRKKFNCFDVSTGAYMKGRRIFFDLQEGHMPL